MLTTAEQLIGRWYEDPKVLIAREADHVRPGIPIELVAWHEVVSRLVGPELVVQNHAVSVDQLEADAEGMIMFWYEAQYCWEWAIASGGHDPAVVGREPGDREWREIGMTLSRFLYWATALELAFGAKNKAYVGRLSGEEIDSLIAGFEAIGGSRFDLYTPAVGFLSVDVIGVIEQVYYADTGNLFSITVAAPESLPLESYLSEFSHFKWRVSGRTPTKSAVNRKLPF